MSIIGTTVPIIVTQCNPDLIVKSAPGPPIKKIKKVDQFVAESQGVFVPGKGEYLVDCTLCKQTFLNPEVPALKAHLASTKHKRHASLTAGVDQIEPTQIVRPYLVKCHTLMTRFACLIKQDGSNSKSLICKYCRIPFEIEYSRVDDIVRVVEEHCLTERHRTLEAESLSPKKVGKDRQKRQLEKKLSPELKNLELLYMQKEVEKYPQMLTIRNNNALFCSVCNHQFGCSYISSYASSVKVHLNSKAHKDVCAALGAAPTEDNEDDHDEEDHDEDDHGDNDHDEDDHDDNDPPGDYEQDDNPYTEDIINDLCSLTPEQLIQECSSSSSTSSSGSKKLKIIESNKMDQLKEKILRTREQLLRSRELIDANVEQLDRLLQQLERED